MLTTTNYITLNRTACAVSGTVSVQGSIQNRCSSAALSNSANINIVSNTPVVTVAPPQGYAGSTACNKTPVTFTATLSPPLTCIGSVGWQFPSGWSWVSQTGNTVTLKPTGAQSDAGAVTAGVQFSCGTTVSNSFTVPYIIPVVSGPELVCSTGQFTLLNAPSATPTWSVTSYGGAGLSINSSGLASRGVNNYNGDATVVANLNCNGTSAQKLVWVGSPILIGGTAGTSNLLLDGTISPDLYWNNVPVGNRTLSVYRYGKTSTGANTTVNFSNIRRTPTMTYPAVTSSSTANIANYTWFVVKQGDTYTINVSSSNSCGSFARTAVVTTTSDPNPARQAPIKPQDVPVILSELQVQAPSIFPNPSKDSFIVGLCTDVSGSALDGTLKSDVELMLYNSLQQIIFRGSTNKSLITISTEGLQAGAYYLQINHSKGIERKQVIIK